MMARSCARRRSRALRTRSTRPSNCFGTSLIGMNSSASSTSSAIAAAKHSAQVFQVELTKAGKGTITTEIDEAPTVYFAEAYHQQYLAKNPEGYCGIGGTGVTCPI